MFKAPKVEARLVPGPHRFEAHASCVVDVSPEAAWERVADPSIPLAGDTSHVASGLLPGHTMGLGALGYEVRRAENGLLDGPIMEVVAWDPPRRFAVRALQETSDRVTVDAAWRVDAQGEGGAVIQYAVRIEVLVPADPSASPHSKPRSTVRWPRPEHECRKALLERVDGTHVARP